MIGKDRGDADEKYNGIDKSHGAHSLDRPNHGRNLIPTVQPPSAAANQIQPCSDPDATPPTNAPMLQPKSEPRAPAHQQAANARGEQRTRRRPWPARERS